MYALTLSFVSGALPSLKLGHGCGYPYVSKIVYGNQEWSYSEVDIALDSESIGRGFESHYDQFCLEFLWRKFRLGFCFCFLCFSADSDILAAPTRYSTFLWTLLVPRPQLPAKRIVTECRISPVLMHPYQPFLPQMAYPFASCNPLVTVAVNVICPTCWGCDHSIRGQTWLTIGHHYPERALKMLFMKL